MSIYIVIAFDNDGTYEYEYGNIDHAEQHYNTEEKAMIVEYKDGEHYFIKAK